MGFDYVPGDMLAALTAAALDEGETPDKVRLGYHAPFQPSQGTMRSGIEMIKGGDVEWRERALRPASQSVPRPDFDFGDGLGVQKMMHYPSAEHVTVPTHLTVRTVETALTALWDCPPLVGDRVTVVGAARSGVAAALLLASRGAHVTLSDARPALPDADRDRLTVAGVALELGGPDYLDDMLARQEPIPAWQYAGDAVEEAAGLQVARSFDVPVRVVTNSMATDGDDFEFIELANIGPSAVALDGVRFNAGVLFDFTTGAITNLPAGAQVLGVPVKFGADDKRFLIGALVLIYLVLGTALDGISMIVLTSAVVLPMIQKAGFDLIWFGIFIILLVEIAEVTPPVGFNLFVLQNMTGKDSNVIAKAAIPFFICLVVCIALITLFPQIVTIVPDLFMGKEQ